MGEAKRRREAEQRRQQTLLKMSVANTGTQSMGEPLKLTHELRQCHAALLYADEVKLISPRAAMLRAALDFTNWRESNSSKRVQPWLRRFIQKPLMPRNFCRLGLLADQQTL